MRIVIKHFDELTTRELYEIAKVRFEVFVCEQEITCEQDFDDRDQLCHHVMVLNDTNNVIGYCRIVPKKIAYKSISIGRVLVLKNYRRKNLASDMMKVAMEYIGTNLNEDSIILSAQLYVEKFYSELGFTPISDIYYEAGIEHIKMEYKF